MTSIVGVLCQDGAVLGTDSSVTFSDGRIRTIEQSAEKLHIIENRVLLAGTGAVGHGQRFEAIIREGAESKRFGANRSPLDVCKELSGKTIADFKQTNSPTGLYGALVAFPLGQKTVLCEFDVQHFQPQLLTEQIWFCSMGSAQGITRPVSCAYAGNLLDNRPTFRERRYVRRGLGTRPCYFGQPWWGRWSAPDRGT